MPCHESHTKGPGVDDDDLGDDECGHSPREPVIGCCTTQEQNEMPKANPNPMNSRCGLEDCDCEYTIGGLLRRLEIIAEQAQVTVANTRAICLPECDKSCACYQDGHQAGYEAERRPIGR